MSITALSRFRHSRRPAARLSVVSLTIAIVASVAIASPSLGATSLHNGSFEHVVV